MKITSMINRLTLLMLLPCVVFTSISHAQDTSSDWGFNAMLGMA